MQARRAAGQQPFAQRRHHIQAEGLDRRAVVAEAGQLQAHPARDLGAAHVGEAHQLRVVRDRHDAGHHRDIEAQFLHLLDKLEIRIGVVEVLGDGGVGPGLHLALEGQQIVLWRPGLRVDLGIGRHFDVEPVARFGADEFHQLVGVTEFAGRAVAAGQVAAQRHHALDVIGLVLVEDGADRLTRAAHAGQVRRGVFAGGLDFQHGVQRAALGRTAGAEGHRKIFGVELGQLGARDAQFFRAFRRLGREEFDTEVRSFHLRSSKVR